MAELAAWIVVTVAMVTLMWTLRQRDRFIEWQQRVIHQLADRVATYKFSDRDDAIGRIHATMPPSVKEALIGKGPDVRARKPKEKPEVASGGKKVVNRIPFD